MRVRAISRHASHAVSLALLVAACTSATSTPSGRHVDVTIKDFDIEPAAGTILAGKVTLDVWNEGPTTHEFVVVRTELPADSLPIASDGLSVDEDHVMVLDELDEVEDGTFEALTVSLTPGRYVMFCNLDGHYLGGMHAAVEVTDA